jgi:hypothetical protein
MSASRGPAAFQARTHSLAAMDCVLDDIRRNSSIGSVKASAFSCEVLPFRRLLAPAPRLYLYTRVAHLLGGKSASCGNA